jgi:starvation-inducible DNA-binding protein
MPHDKQLKDNNEEFATQRSTPAELWSDNQQVTRSLRSTHEVCEQHNDVATVSLLENWIDA